MIFRKFYSSTGSALASITSVLIEELSKPEFFSFNFLICLASLSASRSILAYIDSAASSTLIVPLLVLHKTSATCLSDAAGFLITGLLRAGVHDGRYVPYNSMFVIDEKGEIKDYYDKVHLVPFGEYLPFRELWPSFMAPVANVVGDLGRGEKYKNMQISGLPLLGGAICYESIFPKQVLNPRNRPEILVVVANDGWYGVSAGPFQHLAAAQMRAVEEGITVIRSANTGISAVIAPNGDMSGIIGLNEKGISDTALPKVLAKKTLYGQFGNLIPGILVLLCWVLGWCLKRGK